MSWQETLVGGGLVLAGGVAGSYLTHRLQRQDRRDDRRTEELLAIQDDVTDLQEFCVKYAARKRAGAEIDADLVTESMRSRQNIWKRLARIDSEELWDSCPRLIAATSKMTRAQTVPDLDSAMKEIGSRGADIQQLVGKLLGGTARQLDAGVELPD